MDQPAMESHTIDTAARALDALDEGTDEDNPVLETDGDGEEAEVAETDEDSDDSSDEDSEEEAGDAADDEPDNDDSEQASIETLADLAEALDLPLEEVMANLKTTVKVNGEEIPVTLKEAFDGYQKDADYRNKTTELANQRREFESTTKQVREKLESEYLQMGQLMQALEQSIVPALDPNEMESLKQTDPQTYLLVKQEHAERKQQFQQMRQHAANQFIHNQQAVEAQTAQQRQAILAKSREELTKRIPTWDADTKNAIDTYLSGENFGYTNEELSQVTDARLIELAWKAQQFDALSKKSDAAKKKLKTLPKFSKPGVKQTVRPESKKLQQAKARLGKTGSIDDAALLIERQLR